MTTELSINQKEEIESVFKSAKDFRSIGEKITSPIDNIISKTTSIIDKDPILNVSGELSKMNNDIQSVYKDIIDNDGTVMKFFKSLPVVGSVAKKIDEKIDEASFNLKKTENKIESLFSGFDLAYNSLNTSIEMQKDFLKGIEDNIGSVIAYKDFLEEKIIEFKEKSYEEEKQKYDIFLRNVEFFLSNLVVLIGNLEMAKKRLLIRINSAQKLSLSMNASKPIFKTLISTAVIETSGQKAIDASIKTIESIGKTIDKMSSQLTDKAIKSNKASEKLSQSSILSTSVFIENVTKLKNNFEEMESYRKQIAEEKKKEEEEFEKATNNLKLIKTINTKEMDELNKELQSGF